MKKIMSLLGSVAFVAAMCVSCGGNNNANDTIQDTAIDSMPIDTVAIETVIADTTPVQEEVAAAPAKKTSTTKTQKKVDPTSKEAAQKSGTTVSGLQQVGAAGSDIRKDQQKEELKKAASTLNVTNKDTKKK